MSGAVRLPPLYYHIFRKPVPYVQALAAQESIHATQLFKRAANGGHTDVLLLLEHRPVYTAGRRQTENEISGDRTRLTRMGADFVSTQRGGELTYHGPGQIVGYPLFDLSRTTPPTGTRDYVCQLQTAMKSYLRGAHGIESGVSEHTGVFLDQYTKIASIGVRMRHRLVSHGFALNVTNEPRSWFDQVVACGLADVKAGSIESATGQAGLNVREEMRKMLPYLQEQLTRELKPFDKENPDEDILKEIQTLERVANDMEPHHTAPTLSS